MVHLELLDEEPGDGEVDQGVPDPQPVDEPTFPHGILVQVEHSNARKRTPMGSPIDDFGSDTGKQTAVSTNRGDSDIAIEEAQQLYSRKKRRVLKDPLDDDEDFTDDTAVVDLACMRDAMSKIGSDPNKINPQISRPTPLHRSNLELASNVSKFEEADHKPVIVKDYLAYLSELGSRRVGLTASVIDLSDDLVRLIMEKMTQSSLISSISSSRIFARSAFQPCYCQSSENRGAWLIGAIAEEKHSKELLVTWAPARDDHQLFVAASTFLNKYIAICSRDRSWYRIVATRDGMIAVATNSTARFIHIWTPFGCLSSISLPESPFLPATTIGDLLSAALLPLPRGLFDLVMIFSGEDAVTIKYFRSETRRWHISQAESPVHFFPRQHLEMPVNRNGLMYVLDREHGRLLAINLEHNIADLVILPYVPFSICDQILSKNNGGNPVWAVLSRTRIHTFELEAAGWTRRRSFPLPALYHSCRFMGLSADTGHVVIICGQMASFLSVDDGTVVRLTNVPPIKTCHCFVLRHPSCDHCLRWQ